MVLVNTNTFPLDIVTLGATSIDIFDWCTSEIFSRGVLVCACSTPITVHKSKHLKAPENISIFECDNKFKRVFFERVVVLNCEPLSTGHIGLKTKIIIVNNNKYGKHDKEETVVKIDRHLYPSALLTILNGINPFQGIAQGTILNSTSSGPSFLSRQTGLCISSNVDQFYAILGGKFDVFNGIFVTTAFARSTGIIDSSYVQLELANDNKSSTTCLFKVANELWNDHFHSDEGSMCGMLALPTVGYALGLPNDQSSTMVSYKLFSRGATKFISSSLYSDRPHRAKELHIRCIQSPTYNSSSNFGPLLQKYFTTTRIVQLNKVMVVPSKDDPDLWYDLQDPSEGHADVVYFEVMAISPSPGQGQCYLAHTNYTTVYQEASGQNYVPSVMESVISGCHRSLPTCLNQYHSYMMDLIKPCLHSTSSTNVLHLPSFLLSGPRGCGLSALAKSVATSLNMHCLQLSCHLLVGETSGATETKVKQMLQVARLHAPCVLLMEHIHVMAKDRDASHEDPRVASTFHSSIQLHLSKPGNFPVIVIAATNQLKSCSSTVVEGFLYHVKVDSPSEDERADVLPHLLSGLELGVDVATKVLAQRTAGMVLADLVALVSHARSAAYHRIISWGMRTMGCHTLSQQDEERLVQSGIPLTHCDFEEALDKLHKSQVDQIGSAKIPKVHWDDIGGLDDVKDAILDTIQLPLEQPQLFTTGLRRSGVLLYGPPGTGKTLCAKAVATECSLNFLSVKGPELINMYVGQSEENIREVFRRARQSSPCVVFFDELDSLAPNRGRSGDSGGVMDRVVSQLLAELDGVTKSCDVFVIGATNRPDLLDSALLRPGRFDKLVYVGISQNKEDQLGVLQALTKNFHLSVDCQLEDVIDACPAQLTGADFYALCSDAMLKAIKRIIDGLESGEEVDQSTIQVSQEDFMKALENLTPSVSQTELQRYEQLKRQYVKSTANKV